MTSSISTTGINVDYPIAGVNNSSQGFRDNFNAIKQALESAKSEITELTDFTRMTLLRQPVGQYFNNDLNYNVISRAQLRAPAVSYAENSIADNQIVIDYFRGSVQMIDLISSVSLRFDNFPIGGLSSSIRLYFKVFAPGLSVQFFQRIIQNLDNPLLIDDKLTFNRSGEHMIEFQTVDNGATFFLVSSNASAGPPGPQGVPGIDSVVKIGNVYSYMYAGSKAAGNQSKFDMVTISGLGNNGILELSLAHHHSGVGMHGAYRRVSYALNAYTTLLELENFEKTFDSGVTFGNVGFAVSRPTTGNVTISWLGNVSFDTSFTFYMTVNGNQQLTFSKINLD